METRIRSPIRRLARYVLAAALALATAAVAIETIPDKPYGEKWADVSPEMADALPALDFWKTLDPKIPQKYFYYRPSLHLFVLRYPITRVAEGDSREFRAAVKAFQRDLGSKPTGVLTVAQYITLEDRAAWLRTAWVDPWFGTPTVESRIAPSEPTVLYQDEDSENVSVVGLLASEALSRNRNLTMVHVECQKHSMICSTAAVADNFWFGVFDYDGPLARASIPFAELVTLHIDEWTDTRIVASPQPGSEARLCLVLLPQSGKAYKGQVVEVDPLAPPATDASAVPAGPGLLCAQDEELLPLETMPVEVQRRTAQLYGEAARAFVADWEAKDQEYHDALEAAAAKRKQDAAKAAAAKRQVSEDAAKTPGP